MIQLEEVSFTYPGTDKKSLNNIHLDIKDGECVLVTGLSGCGKSTLTRILNGLCPKFYEGKLEGNYFLNGKNSELLSLDEIGELIGSVFQDPRSQFFCKKVRDEIVLAMENHCMPREEMKLRLNEIIELLGIGDLLDRDMQDLSSGEKQKVAIASVFALGPKCLVLDEPSANLDTNATEQLAKFLKYLKSKGHTLLISEHRLYYMKDIFDRMIILKDGEILKEYTREEALSLSNIELKEMGLRLFDTPQFKVNRSIRNYQNCFLRGDHISLRLNDTQILKDVTLGTANATVTAVTGSNGAGKTTICKILTGIQKEHAGIVYINQKPTKKKERIRQSFFVQQDVDYQLYMPTVEEEILMASKYSKEDSIFHETTTRLGLSQLLKRHPQTLSGGQKQRVLIAAAILRDAPIMVLDEPTSGLDGYHMREVSKILNDIAVKGKNVLLVTHDVEFICEVADSLIYMNKCEVGYHRSLDKTKADESNG